MNVFIRTDASRLIGTGHVMRCLTLADALRGTGSSVRFISRVIDGDLHALIRQRGYEVASLPAAPAGFKAQPGTHEEWLGTSWMQDAKETSGAIQSFGASPTWLIVDHYGLGASWEERLRASAGHVMAIDDTADRPHDCDLLLDQNLFHDMRSRYDGKVPPGSRLLLGPDYALLRSEFREVRSGITPRSGPVHRVLVFLGGADAANYTAVAIEALAKLVQQPPATDVVIGAHHPCRQQIVASCEAHGFACHVQVSHMAQLMASADLAIGAGGSASWERCCVGLPAITVSVAENQVAIAQELAEHGACRYLGSHAAVDAAALAQAVDEMASQPREIERMSSRAYALVDGLGASRVAQTLGSLS